MPPAVVISPADQATRVHGMPTPAQAPRHRRALRQNPWRCPAPMDSPPCPPGNAVQLLCEANAAANTGSQCGHAAVHQSGQARLDDLQYESAAALLSSSRSHAARSLLLHYPSTRPSHNACSSSAARSPRSWRTAASLVWARACLVEIARASRSILLDFPAHGIATVKTEWSPQRLPGDEAGHILTADERDVLAEMVPVQLDEPVAVAVFLDPHGFEGLAGRREVPADAPGQIGVDAPVFLFGLDGQREHFLHGEFFDRLGHKQSDRHDHTTSRVEGCPCRILVTACAGTLLCFSGITPVNEVDPNPISGHNRRRSTLSL